MKRITLAIVTIALCVGVFAPVTLSLTAHDSVVAAPLTAYAGEEQSARAGEGLSGITAQEKALGIDKYNTSTKQAWDFTTQFNCGFNHIAGCIEWILYFIPFKVGGWMMQAAALAFDSTAALTLSSALYSSTSFIADGWRVTRDIGNIFFILILMVAALALVLDIEIGHANPKKLVASVIFIALIVNFSFFITEAVIDVSNSLALVFYNQITVQNKDGDIANKRTGDTNGVVQPKSISTALVQTFQPQQLQSPDFWNSLVDKSGSIGNQGNYGWGGCKTGAVGGLVIGGPIGAALGCVVGGLVGYFIPSGAADPVVPDSIIISVEILVGIMYGVVAYSFFVAMLSFIGRLIGLWLAIIFSPLAFVSYIVPSARHLEGFGWSAWWSNLFTLAFAGPIYFFFLYLISLMAQSSFVSASAAANPQTGNAMAKLMIVFLAFIFLIVMLLRATSYVKKASGEIGGMVFKSASMLGGLAIGTTAGLIGGTLARTVGAIAKNNLTETNLDIAAGRVNTNSRAALLKRYEGTDKHEALEKMDEQSLARSSEFQKFQRETARDVKRWQKNSTRSFDFRNTGIGGAIGSATGMNMESFGFLSTQNTAGGYEGLYSRDAAKKRAFTDSLGADHEELVALENALVGREDKEKDLRSQLELARREKEKFDKKTEPKDWKKADDKVVELQQKVNALSQGDKKWKIGDEYTDSNNNKIILTRDDALVGTDKDLKWTKDDIGKEKANGKKVSEMDVAGGKLHTDALSTTDLRRALERAKTDRAKSFAMQQMYQSRYLTEHVAYDQFGQVSQMGHLKSTKLNTEGIRAWHNSAKAALGGNMLDAIQERSGELVAKSVVKGLENVFVTGDAFRNITSALYNIRKVLPANPIIESNSMSKYSADMREKRAINAFSDFTHQIHDFHAAYKSPGGGFFDFLKSLGSGGGDGHGGGGHGGGGHGGGDHGHGGH